LGLTAAAVPTIGAIVISRMVNSIVDVFIPLDEKKERAKFYNHSHKIIKSSALSDASSLNFDTSDDSPPDRDDEDSTVTSGSDWMDHVERAKAELATAHKKVRCAKCKKDIEEVKDNLESRTGEMVRNAKRHKTMTGLQKQGKIKPGKTWKDLTPNEKKMIKSMET